MIEFTHAVTFTTHNNDLFHAVLCEGTPDISSLKSFFDELINDEDFGVSNLDFINELKVDILKMNELKSLYPELDFSFVNKDDQKT